MPTQPKNPALNWISARHLQHIVAQGQAAGISMDSWLEEAGLATAELTDGNATIPLAALEILLNTLSRHQAIPQIGLLLASEIQPATLGPLGHIAQACTNFGDVLAMAVRFNGLLSNIGELSVIHHPGTVEVCWECRAGSEAFRRQAREYVLGTTVVLARFLLPEQKHPILAVNFPHTRPEDAGHTRSYFTFFRAPVYFDQPQASLLIPASLLKIRMHHGDAFVKQLLEQHAARLLEQNRRQPELEDEVRHLLRVMLIQGNPSKDAVARQLGLSGRHLHRQLQAAGTNFRDLLHAERMQQTQALLADPQIPVADISQRMGFASRQAFLRWFRQSTGTTPNAYRRNSI